jgi:5'-methylthioadenosine phosphorylase
MVTDFDCWHPDHDDVTVEAIITVLLGNADKGRALVKTTTPKLKDRFEPCHAGCQTALERALITTPDARDPEMIKKLNAVAGRVLG